MTDSESGSNGHPVASPDEYQAKAAELSGITHNYMANLAKELAPVLSAKARAMPQNTYEEKQAVSRWVNAELRRFDLGIKCHKTGQPAILVVTAGHIPEAGRYTYQIKRPNGKATKSFQTLVIPEFELMEAAPRREGVLQWNEKIMASKAQGGASRS